MHPTCTDNILYWLSRPCVLIVLFGFLLIPSKLLTALAGQTEHKSGAEFLNIAIGARAVGMGGAYTALSHDATSIYWNPAGLSSLSKKEISLMHSEWLMSSQYQFAGFGLPTKMGAWGFGVFRLSNNPMEGRGESRELSSSINSGDQAFSLSYSRVLGERTNLGTTIKLIQSQIGSYNASAFALDLGAQHQLNRLPIKLGMSLQNLGTGLKFINQTDPLPLSFSIGFAYQALPGLSLALDIKQKIYNNKNQISIGSEYQIFPTFALRAGYLSGGNLSGDCYSPQASGCPLPIGLAGGFGLKLLNSQLDYALTPFEELGNTHRLSLSLRF